MKLIRFVNTWVDVEKILAIENGQWDNEKQDYRAILVMHGDTRVHLELYIRHILEVLNDLT